jgi:hypothetical protein
MSPPAPPTTDLDCMDRVLAAHFWRRLRRLLRRLTKASSPGPRPSTYTHFRNRLRATAVWGRGGCSVILDRESIQEKQWVRITIERSAREAYMAAERARVEAGQSQGFALHRDYPYIHSMPVSNVHTFKWIKRELAELKRVCYMF